jgi:hypothetical protein
LAKNPIIHGGKIMIIVFIPATILLIIYIFCMGMGLGAASVLAENIIRNQNIIAVIMIITALCINIYLILQNDSNKIVKACYCGLSTFLDSIKEMVCFVLVMTFLREFVNYFNKDAFATILLLGVVYIGGFVIILCLCFLGNHGVQMITGSLLETKYENAALIISFLINIIWTAVYCSICISVAKSSNTAYTQLFKGSYIDSYLMQVQNLITGFVGLIAR